MTEHVAKFSVIWLSLLADADGASQGFLERISELFLMHTELISVHCSQPFSPLCPVNTNCEVVTLHPSFFIFNLKLQFSVRNKFRYPLLLFLRPAAIFPGWLDLTWAIRISIRCPLPAPAQVSQMNYIAKTSRSPHQKLLSKRCLNIAKKAMRSKSWGPWQTQQVGEMVCGEERCKNVFFVATKQIMFLSRFLITGAHIPVEYLDWGGCWNGLLDLKHGS